MATSSPHQTFVQLLYNAYLTNSQTLKMIFQVESFLYSYTPGTPEEGRRIQRSKRFVLTYLSKDEDNSLKNHNQNDK